MSFAEKASEAIRAHGGRLTAQRQILIDLLDKAAGQIDAESLHHQAQTLDPNINLATVYRTLEVLEEARLIRSHYTSPVHDRKRYSLSAAQYHFTCRRCHRVIPFASDLVELIKQQLEQSLHVQALKACVCIDGLCATCQEQLNADEAKALRD